MTALDLGPTFHPEASRLNNLLEERDKNNKAKIPTGVSYLDDCLGGVYPKDLFLLGAATGVGKTELAVQIALTGCKTGREVFLLALEAEEGEIASRLYFRELARLANDPRIDYASWWRGQWEKYDKMYHDQVNQTLAPLLSKLHVLYKGRGPFTTRSLSQALDEISNRTEMTVLDHVHVIDSLNTEGDLRAQAKTVRILRDMALDRGIPVVAVSHLRKKTGGERGVIVSDTDDFHGSGDISKTATQCVILSRDWDGPRAEPWLSPTFVRVTKDRKGRATPIVGRVYYDCSRGSYLPSYELGRLESAGGKQQWKALTGKHPLWAKGAELRL